MKRNLLGCTYTCLLLGLGVVANAQGEKFKLTGVIENYWLAQGNGHTAGVRDIANWTSIEGRFSPRLRFVVGEFEIMGRQLLDESFVEFGSDAQQWRVGRFRSAFGHSDWSELWYSGFPRQPLMRNLSLGSGLVLNRLDTGVDWHGGSGAIQYQVGLIDARARSWEPLPMRFNHLVGRVQFYKGSWIVGLNTLLETEQIGTGQNRVFGLDWRWTAPHIQTRGELFWGRTSKAHASGYYFDIFYHPPKLTRTTVLARLEASSGTVSGTMFDPYSGTFVTTKQAGTAQLYTIGVKHILSKYFTAELSQAWGNGATPAQGRQGWAFQLMTSLHF